MPQTRLPERPKPPTGQEMLADIAGADDNDVVFLTGQALDLSDLTPSTPEGGGEGADKALTQASLARAQKRESAQRAYHKALELLDKVKVLEDSPGQLEDQFRHLSDLGSEVSRVIGDLQQSSDSFAQEQASLRPASDTDPSPKSAKHKASSKASKKKR